MPTIKKDELLELLENGKFSPTEIIKGGGQSRLRRIIKNRNEYPLSENQIRNLWSIYAVRWDIVRNIQLPHELQKQIIKERPTLSTLKEFSIHQNFEDDHLKEIVKIAKKESLHVYTYLWISKTQKMLDIMGLEDFFFQINSNPGRQHLFSSALVAILKQDISLLKEVLQKVNIGAYYEVITNNIYFNDECVDILIEKTKKDTIFYNSLMYKLVVKNHLSINKKAKYFLEKY